MSLPRMTTRRWMVIVAAAGLLLGLGAWLMRRAQGFHELAVLHTYLCHMNELKAAAGSAQGRKQALYHSDLALKYDRASRRPWLPVAPDPPEPK